MAKALYGHVGARNDLQLALEVRRLRARVAELEQELAVARATSDAFAATLRVEDDLSTLHLDRNEPALT